MSEPTAGDPVVVATWATSGEAETGLGVLANWGIAGGLRSTAGSIELVVAARDAPAARRALLDARLERTGLAPAEMTLLMKLALVVAFLAVVAFAILTVTLG